MSEVFDVCVIGAGPAGLGFAQEWVERVGGDRIVIVEAGPRVESRFCTVQLQKGCRKVNPCHVISGVGGASGLAGGKLSEYPAGRGLSQLLGDDAAMELNRSVEILSPYLTLNPPANDPELLKTTSEQYRAMSYELRHYNANKYAQADLIAAWSAITRRVEEAGVSVRTDTIVTSIVHGPVGLEVTVRAADGSTSSFEARTVVMATGRTGSDLARSLGASGARHPLDVGVRIEFPSDSWPDLDAVHGDLKLHFGNARTFCTSKSGWISPYRFQDFMLLEGRTDSMRKSEWSNLAISIRTEQTPEPIIRHIREATLNQGPGSSIRQPLKDYIADHVEPQPSRHPDSSFSYWRWGDVNSLFPLNIADELRKAVTKFCSEILPKDAAENAFVFGPELDYYWPTTPSHDLLPGVWAVGDITGEYRGTLQAYTAGRYLVSEVAQSLGHAGVVDV